MWLLFWRTWIRRRRLELQTSLLIDCQSSRLRVSARSFVKESIIHASPERVFTFHELPDALRRLTPPWESSHIVQAAPDIRVGSRAIIQTRIFGLFPVRWVAEHTAYDPPHMFEDVQVEGPFRCWRHRHI